MSVFLLMVIVDLIVEDTHLPIWVHALALAVGSSEFVLSRLHTKRM